jgi:Uma2 family endonuclease
MRSGVAEYWVVDPERKRISQYVFTPDRDINHLQAIADGGSIESAVFQGLAVSLGEIWP